MCGPSIPVVIVAQCSGNSGIKSEKKKVKGSEVFWVITSSLCIAVQEGGGAFLSSLSLLYFIFFLFLFWQVPQPPVHGKHTLHILQTRVFGEEIERKLCRKCKNQSLLLSLSASLWLTSHKERRLVFTALLITYIYPSREKQGLESTRKTTYKLNHRHIKLNVGPLK